MKKALKEVADIKQSKLNRKNQTSTNESPRCNTLLIKLSRPHVNKIF